MTLHIFKTYELTCDGCGDEFSKTFSKENPRESAAKSGWTNGNRTAIDLCGDCVTEGLYIRNGQILEKLAVRN